MSLLSIKNDPNYVNANDATKAAIFEKFAQRDPNYINANYETQQAIRQKFGVAPLPSVENKQTENVKPQPKEKTVGGFISNVIGSGANQIGGVINSLIHPVESVKGALDIGAGALQKALPSKVVNFINNLDSPAGKQAAERAVSSVNALGNLYKNRYGSLQNVGETLYNDPVGVLSDISLLFGGAAGSLDTLNNISSALNKVGVPAKIGVPTKVVNTLTNLENATNIMRPVGQVVGTLPKVAAGAINLGQTLIDPKTAAYAKVIENKGPDILKNLENPDVFVKGSIPTAAEAASPAGATKFAAMGEAAKNVLPSENLKRLQDNQAAQIAAVRSVGKTPEELAQAVIDRDVIAKNLYEKANKVEAPIDEAFKQLEARPSMQKVMNRAQELLQEKGVPFKIIDQTDKPIAYTGESLHAMKMAFDDLIKNPERFGMGANEASAIANTRNKFIDWVEDKIPKYQTAREKYAEQSIPINQMEIGQYLENKLTPALGEKTADLKANMYAKALKEAPATIKKSTGQTRYQDLTEMMTPDQLKILNSVKSDLERGKLTELQATAGKKSDLPKLGDFDSAEIKGLGGLAAKVIPFASYLVNRFKGNLSEKLAIELATEMLSADTAVKPVKKAITLQQKQASITKKGAEIGKQTKNALSSKTLRTLNALNATTPEEDY